MQKIWKILGLTGLMLVGLVVGLVPFLVLPVQVNMVSVQRWMQFVLTITGFLLPALVFWKRIPMRQLPNARTIIYIVELLIAMVPAMNLITWLCMEIPLPAAVKQLAESMRMLEEDQMLSLMRSHGVGESLWIYTVIALVPAVSEEFCFRGALLGTLRADHPETSSRYVHGCIWGVALVFSMVHGDIYGFVPRLLLGALLGYLCVWTGSIWAPILYHFGNNALVVLLNMLEINQGVSTRWIGEELGSGRTWLVGVFALCVVGMLVWQIWKTNTNLTNQHESY